MTTPAGFAPHSSGLLVPEPVARRREVWPRDEWKQVDRAAKVLNAHQVATLMRCGAPGCPDRDLEAQHRPDGSLALRCGCTERILTRAL